MLERNIVQNCSLLFGGVAVLPAEHLDGMLDASFFGKSRSV